MNKNTIGILGLFILIFGITWASNEKFANGYNMSNLVKWSSLYAIMGIGVAFVIITGGIDLSIGSVIGLVAALMALAINAVNIEVTIDNEDGYSMGKDLTLSVDAIRKDLNSGDVFHFENGGVFTVTEDALAEVKSVTGNLTEADLTPNELGKLNIVVFTNLTVVLLLGLSVLIGLVHGLLITKVKLQPFVVTLCGLLFYRGISRWLTDNQTMQYPNTEGLDSFFSGKVLLVDLLAPIGVMLLVLGSVLFIVTYLIVLISVVKGNMGRRKFGALIQLHIHIITYSIILISVFNNSTGWGIGGALVHILGTFFCVKNFKEYTKVFFVHHVGIGIMFLGIISVFGILDDSSFALGAPFFFLLVIAILAAFFLNRTIWGRYLLALGNNEDGARYSGIQTDRMKITAYVICSFLAGVSGLLFAYELDSVQPAQTGEFYELYAIAAAVLGGCSLRGGQGAIFGVIIAAAVIRLLRNSINLVGISTHLEFAIIGLVILGGVTADEIIKRIVAKRRTAQVNAAKD